MARIREIRRFTSKFDLSYFRTIEDKKVNLYFIIMVMSIMYYANHKRIYSSSQISGQIMKAVQTSLNLFDHNTNLEKGPNVAFMEVIAELRDPSTYKSKLCPPSPLSIYPLKKITIV